MYYDVTILEMHRNSAGYPAKKIGSGLVCIQYAPLVPGDEFALHGTGLLCREDHEMIDREDNNNLAIKTEFQDPFRWVQPANYQYKIFFYSFPEYIFLRKLAS